MNYIKRLQLENEGMRCRIDGAMQEIQEFRAYLQGPKFTGIDLDGDRKDWIGTKELDYKLQEIHSELMNGDPKQIVNAVLTVRKRAAF